MFKLSTFILVLSSLLFFQQASAQEEQEKNPFKRAHIAYKYHIVDDEDEIAKTFPKNGHSVQLGYNFWPDDLGFFTLIFDYTHLRKYRDSHVFSAGFDISLHPGKIFAKIRRKPYTPRMEKWLLTAGYYKTLDKYHLNYISSGNLSYRIRLGKVDLLPNIGFTSFDEGLHFSKPRPDENYMGFFTFGLTAQF